MRSHRLLAIAAVICVLVPTIALSYVTTSFDCTGDGCRAGWVHYSPTPPGSNDDRSIEFFVNGWQFIGPNSAGDALVGITGVQKTLPSVAPSFWLRTDRAFDVTNQPGGQYGTPRLSIELENEDNNSASIAFGPTSWPADAWGKADGSSYLWRGYFVPTNNHPAIGGCHEDQPLGVWMTYAEWNRCLTYYDFVVTRIRVSLDKTPTDDPYTMLVDNINFGNLTLAFPPKSCMQDRSGAHENGIISKKIHGAEPMFAPAGAEFYVHRANCSIVVNTLHR